MCERWIDTNVRMGQEEPTARNTHYMAGCQTQGDRGTTSGEYSRTAGSIPVWRAPRRWVQLVRVRATTTTNHIRRQRLEHGCCRANERTRGNTIWKNKNKTVGPPPRFARRPRSPRRDLGRHLAELHEADRVLVSASMAVVAACFRAKLAGQLSAVAHEFDNVFTRHRQGLASRVS